MEKKDLKKLTKGQLIKLLLKKVSNHEDLLDNDPFKDEVAQEPQGLSEKTSVTGLQS